MAEPSSTDPEFVPTPLSGRTFTTERRIRWGDTDQHRRLRLDATARYLQDVANDDTRDAGHDPFAPWVVRRTAIAIIQPVVLGEMVAVTTFSGGLGSRWGERRTSIVGADGGRVEAASLWVFVDPVSGRPVRLTDAFHATYDEAAGGRSVSARLRHPAPPPTAVGRPWPLRSTDMDGLAHVNNAATWAAVEDELSRRGITPVHAEIEYPDAIAPDDEVELLANEDAEGTLSIWLTAGGTVRASAQVRSVLEDLL